MISNELVRLLDKNTNKEVTVRPGREIVIPDGEYISLNYVRLIDNHKTVGIWNPGQAVYIGTKTELSDLTVQQLKDIMRDQGKSMKRNMTKEELLEAINA